LNSYIRSIKLGTFPAVVPILQHIPSLSLTLQSFLFFPFVFIFSMKYASFFAAAAALVSSVSAAGVTGAAEGFAKGVTGGGSATPVYPSTTDELVSYLGDSQARVIILTKTFDFTNTEGTETTSGCAPWGTASNCQLAINKDNWCKNYEPNAPTVSSIT
jgi:pectin lyase